MMPKSAALTMAIGSASTAESGTPCCVPMSPSASKPGVVYTTFHHPVSGANVITTDNSDWATNCPEYKVTAVQLSKVTEPSNWQARQKSFDKQQQGLLQQGLLQDARS